MEVMDHFGKQVGSVEKRLVEKDQQLRDVSEELRLTKVSLSRKEGNGLTYFTMCISPFCILIVELRHLQDQIQVISLLNSHVRLLHVK